MSRRTLRTFAQATTCLAVGVAFTAGCLYAAQPDDLNGPTIVPSSGQATPTEPRTLSLLTPEMIDVLTEGDDADHPWEQCTIAGELITCPDGYTTTWQAPPPDGSITAPGAYAGQGLLVECKGVDREPHLPCRVRMTPTYVVGGDGTVHDHCTITLVTREDSELVCPDDTVWPS